MKPDPSFPTKLDTVADAPEPLRSALMKKLPPEEPVRFLLHAPAFSTGDEKMPATLLAVTKNGWLVAWETEDGSAALEDQAGRSSGGSYYRRAGSGQREIVCADELD